RRPAFRSGRPAPAGSERKRAASCRRRSAPTGWLGSGENEASALFMQEQCRGWPSAEPLLLVSQLAPQDLAHRRLGQVGAELDDLRLLVAGEVGAAIVAHLRLGQRLVLLDDHQLDGLAG